jgi:ribosomal protein S8E
LGFESAACRHRSNKLQPVYILIRKYGKNFNKKAKKRKKFEMGRSVDRNRVPSEEMSSDQQT